MLWHREECRFSRGEAIEGGERKAKKKEKLDGRGKKKRVMDEGEEGAEKKSKRETKRVLLGDDEEEKRKGWKECGFLHRGHCISWSRCLSFASRSSERCQRL